MKDYRADAVNCLKVGHSCLVEAFLYFASSPTVHGAWSEEDQEAYQAALELIGRLRDYETARTVVA